MIKNDHNSLAIKNFGEEENNVGTITSKIKEKIDNLTGSTEIIENNNRLIYDKLFEIDEISQNKNQSPEEKALSIYKIKRNSDCYMTLNYIITNEILKIENELQKIYEYIIEIENIEKPYK